MKINMLIDGSTPAVLTTEHSGSSYNQPVLVVDGTPYGPADIIIQGWTHIWPADSMTDKAADAIKRWMSAAPMIGYCYRCGRIWMMRSPVQPGACPNPKCHSAAWRTPRRGNTPGRKPKK